MTAEDWGRGGVTGGSESLKGRELSQVLGRELGAVSLPPGSALSQHLQVGGAWCVLMAIDFCWEGERVRVEVIVVEQWMCVVPLS